MTRIAGGPAAGNHFAGEHFTGTAHSGHLAKSHRPAGDSRTTFDAKALSSGMYLYELTAGTVRLYNRMMLVK